MFSLSTSVARQICLSEGIRTLGGTQSQLSAYTGSNCTDYLIGSTIHPQALALGAAQETIAT
jgi:hypothetical protein